MYESPSMYNKDSDLFIFCNSKFNRNLTNAEKLLSTASKKQEEIETNYFNEKQNRAKMCPDVCNLTTNTTPRSERKIKESSIDELKGIFEAIIRNFEIQQKTMGINC